MEDVNEFTSFMSNDYTGQFDAQSSIASDIFGGAVATVVDAGTSIFNSVVPEAYETSTQDVLRRVNSNALRVYEENPDTIQTLSFIGGAFIPSGLALKGMGALRAGAKGMSWFSSERRAADLLRLERLASEGPASTQAYKALKREIFANKLKNDLTDVAATEAALLLSMNDHPFMEDYLDEPLKNFGISMALGGTIGGVMGHVAERAAVKNVIAEADSKALNFLSALKPAPAGEFNATAMATRQENINILKRIISDAEEAAKTGDLSQGLLHEKASSILSRELSEQTDAFKKAVGSMQDMPQEYLDEVRNWLVQPGMGHVEAVKPAKIAEGTLRTNAGGLVEEDAVFGDAFTKVKKTVDGRQTETIKVNTRVYVPEINAFVYPKDLTMVGRATALKGVSERSIMSEATHAKNSYMAPREDMTLHLNQAAAPEVDAAYIRELAYIDTIPSKKLLSGEVVVAPDDLPRMKAVIARLAKMRTAGEDVSSAKITVTDKRPIYTEALQQQALKEGGVAATHLDDLKALAKNEHKQYDIREAGISGELGGLIRGWLNGLGMPKLRSAVNAYLRPSIYFTQENAHLGKELYEHPTSVAFRKRLAAMSDTGDMDGHVYMYRGMKGEARGSNLIESFTLDPVKAGKHGTSAMYRIAVKDVIATFKDIPDKDGVRRVEVLVGSPTRAKEATVKVGGIDKSMKLAATKEISSNQISFEDLSSMTLTRTAEVLNDLLMAGHSELEAAIRTGTPLETVKVFNSAGRTKDALLMSQTGVLEYTNAGMIGEYLNPIKQPLAMRSSLQKRPWGEMQATADKATLDRIQKEVTSAIMLSSSSPVVGAIHELLMSDSMSRTLDLVRNQISKVSEGLTGSKFFMSSDAWSRAMGDVGEVASFIGKRLDHIRDNHLTRINDRLSNTFNIIAETPEARVELATALAVRNSRPGFAWYENKQFWENVETTTPDGKSVMTPRAITYQGNEFKVRDNTVDQALSEIGSIGREIFDTSNTYRKIMGMPQLNNRGFWSPAPEMLDEHVALVLNKADGTVKTLTSKTADGLRQLQADYIAANASRVEDGTIKVVTQASREEYNNLIGRTDPIFMQSADVSLRHSGASTPALIRADADVMSNLMKGYERTVNHQVTSLAEVSMYDISENLQRIARVNQEYTKHQPLSKIKAAVFNTPDVATSTRNMLLGLKDLSYYKGWQMLNEGFEAVANSTMLSIQKSHDTLVGTKEGKNLISYAEFAERTKELDQLNPYKITFGDAAEAAWIEANKNANPINIRRMISLTNSFAATAALRFAEVAHPLVNAMSLPILMTANLADHMPASYLGANKVGKILPMEAMAKGVQQAWSLRGSALDEKWLKAGYFESMVSEATKVLKIQRQFEVGKVAAAERFMESNFVKKGSILADYSEQEVRRISMHTGYYVAKQLYPTLGDDGCTIFAKNFMDRVVGNYHAPQRPVMFQGTMGSAMGLFQTYMLTMGQALYRQMELKNYKGLGKTLLAQSAIFGGSSMPGYQVLSEVIGEHFSDDHVDLTTGTVRALDDNMAKAALFGVPSSLGAAFYTRGDLSPRINTPLNITEWPAFNMAGQTINSVAQVAGAAMEGEHVGRSMMQALSLQSVSRPLARGAELATGYSVTQQGRTVSTPDEVWTPLGITARLLGTRTTEEALLRETEFMRRNYESMDRDARQKVVNRIRTALRDGVLSQQEIEQFALDYMDKGGSAQGWRAALNKAIAEAPANMGESVRKELDPDSPLNLMMDMLDGGV